MELPAEMWHEIALQLDDLRELVSHIQLGVNYLKSLRQVNSCLRAISDCILFKELKIDIRNVATFTRLRHAMGCKIHSFDRFFKIPSILRIESRWTAALANINDKDFFKTFTREYLWYLFVNLVNLRHIAVDIGWVKMEDKHTVEFSDVVIKVHAMKNLSMEMRMESMADFLLKVPGLSNLTRFTYNYSHRLSAKFPEA